MKTDMNHSAVIASAGPLRLKAQINGIPKLQGIFTLKDEYGFPMDMSYEMAKEMGWQIDWVEALADAARQSVSKYQAVLDEIQMLEPKKIGIARLIFIAGFMAQKAEAFEESAKALYRQMHQPARS